MYKFIFAISLQYLGIKDLIEVGDQRSTEPFNSTPIFIVKGIVDQVVCRNAIQESLRAFLGRSRRKISQQGLVYHGCDRHILQVVVHHLAAALGLKTCDSIKDRFVSCDQRVNREVLLRVLLLHEVQIAHVIGERVDVFEQIFEGNFD